MTAVAYGAGAVWVTNFVRDEIVRVDAGTNEVTERIPLAGTPPSVAADDETAWVSIAGAPRGETLPASACGPVVAGAGRPDVLIASDLPLQGRQDVTRVMADAIRFVLREHELPRRPTHGRLPVLRRLDGADGDVRLHQVRLEREGVCRDRSRGRSDRPLQLALRVGPDTDRESRRGAARHDQPLEHPCGPDARRSR